MERRHQGYGGPSEADGQLLVTTDHEVIRRWAEECGAEPAVAAGSVPGDAGALRFATGRDAEEHDDGLKPVTWEKWLDAFERAGLRFVYRDGWEGSDDFYRLEAPGDD